MNSNPTFDLSRVVVCGISGSGKSWLARRLAAELEAVYTDLDNLHWQPGWVPRSAVEFGSLVTELARAERWIVAGNYSEVHPILWPRATTVIWLNLPFRTTLWQAFSRTLRRVAMRIEASPGCQESWSQFYTSESIPWFVLTHYHDRRQRYGNQLRAHAKAGYATLELNSKQEMSSLLSEVSRQ